MKKIIYILVLSIPFLAYSQTKIRISGFSEYDSWTHMDPFYEMEPSENPDIDNFRPVEYEERETQIKIGLDSPLMKYGAGIVGLKIDFVKKWNNRKHIKDGDTYFEYGFPLTPYQTKSDYIKYGMLLYYGLPLSNFKPYLGFGGEFKIEGITSTFIYIDDQFNANYDPIISIPVDEHVERRFNYYGVLGVDVTMGRYFYIVPQLRLYFSEVELDEKHIIRNRKDKSQWRPMIELGFVF